MAQKQKPVNEIRLGRIRAAIWANQTEHREVWFNVTVTRLYKDGDQWKDTATFRRDDLPIVAKVVDMAYAWIWGQEVPADPAEAVE
jgi:aryl-phospho-beta-D-glucosidase BglC (GH1 family)